MRFRGRVDVIPNVSSIDIRHIRNLFFDVGRLIIVESFPITGWLIMIVPPVLMILSVALFYRREVTRERLEDKLLRRDIEEDS